MVPDLPGPDSRDHQHGEAEVESPAKPSALAQVRDPGPPACGTDGRAGHGFQGDPRPEGEPLGGAKAFGGLRPQRRGGGLVPAFPSGEARCGLLSTAGIDPEHEAAGVKGGGPAGGLVGSGLFSLTFPAPGGLSTSVAPPL